MIVCTTEAGCTMRIFRLKCYECASSLAHYNTKSDINKIAPTSSWPGSPILARIIVGDARMTVSLYPIYSTANTIR